MTKKDIYTQKAIEIANDNSHGYSQAIRWGPSYDCSSLVITVVQNAGIPVKQAGASYTGNMRDAFIRCGFIDVTGLVNLQTGNGMEKGDILLNEENHTAIYIGRNEIVHARSSEGTSDTADNSGNEIRIQSYWNFPWDCVLRFGGEVDEKPNNNGSTVIVKPIPTNTVPYDTVGNVAACIQGMLKYHGYPLGWYGIDGDTGGENSYTNQGLRKAIANHEIPQDLIDLLLNYQKKEETK